VLTTGVDTVLGSTGVDVITGSTSGLASDNTFNNTDKIDGGGGNDRLVVTLNTDFAGFTTGSIANVETISLTNANPSARTFNALGTTGATKFEIDANDQNFTLSGLSSIPTVKLTNQNGSTGRDFTVEFGAASIPTGTSDAMTLELSDVGRAAVAATATAAAVTVQPTTLNLSNIEVANVTTAGTTVDVAFGGTLTNINLAGSAATTVASTPTTLTSFDASNATGAVTAALTTGGTAGRITAIKGGTAVDKVTINVADVAANAVISGGAGADVLTVTGNAGGTKQYAMSDVETVTFAVSGALTFSGAKASGLTTVTSSSTNTALVTLVGMGASDLEVKASGVTNNAGGITSDSTGNVTVSYSAAAATVAAASAADAPDADYTFAAMTGALTVNVGAFIDTSSTEIVADKATSLVINTTSGTTTASTPVQLTHLQGRIDADAATSITINSAGLLGAAGNPNVPFVVESAEALQATITQGTSAGYLELNTPELTTLNLTAGNTFDLTGSDFSALQVVTADVAKNTLTIPGIATAASVTLSGAGATSGSPSQVVLGGALGQSTNTYGLTLTASGLKGGLSSGNVAVRGGDGYATTIDVSGVSAASATAKAVDLGAIGGSAAGAVTINAAGTVGAVEFNNVDSAAAIKVTASPTKTFTIGNLTSASNAGNVELNVDGTTGAVKIGTFTGNNVTVKASDTIGGVKDATSAVNKFVISAKSSATVEVSSLEASTVTITSSSGSTGLAVALKGGSDIDTVTVTGAAGSNSLALTGDLGLGDDVVTVNGTAYTGTGSQTISLAGLQNYDVSSLTGSNAKDSIVGGSGRDLIVGGPGQDTLTGGAGKDVFLFNLGDSPVSAPDTITDFTGGTSGDTITWGGGAISRALQADVTGTGITINANSVVTFASTPASLTAAATAVSTALDDAGKFALFSYGGISYAFISDGETAAHTNDVVVILTGVTLPTTALSDGTDTANDPTGLQGFGA
jgi:trimeric autotransporter adhesin